MGNEFQVTVERTAMARFTAWICWSVRPENMKKQHHKEITALEIVALAIDETRARGTTKHKKALAFLESAKQMWREKFAV